MDNDFSAWVQENLRRKGWSQADLVRASGLTKQVISHYMSDKAKRPDHEALRKLCAAFGLPVSSALVALGMLPRPERKDELKEEAIGLLEQMSPASQEEVLEYLRFRVETSKRHDKYQQKRGKRGA